METLNVGSSPLNNLYRVLDAFNIDVKRSRCVQMVCDVQHLPFVPKIFRKVLCFHVLEHVPDPVQALREMIRVCSGIIEVEVPHRFDKHANNHDKNKFDEHLWSFKTMWFHKVLKNYPHHLRVLWCFPRELYIHVWIYPKGELWDDRDSLLTK